MTKLTQPQSNLLEKLPEFFFIFEDQTGDDWCPPTEIKDIDGRRKRVCVNCGKRLGSE